MRDVPVWLGLAPMLVLSMLRSSPVAAMESAPEPELAAAKDSAWYAPIVRHGWIEGGVAWMSGPDAIRRNFEAGQGYGAGVESRFRNVVRLRLGGDYQIFPAKGVGRVIYDATDSFGTVFTDTLQFAVRSPGWVASLRAEAGLPGPGGTFFFGGGGPAWFDDGMDDLRQRLSTDIVMNVEGAGSDGWAWFTTAGVLCNLEGLLGFPVALDLHWRSVRRGGDDTRFWTMRVGTLRP